MGGESIATGRGSLGRARWCQAVDVLTRRVPLLRLATTTAAVIVLGPFVDGAAAGRVPFGTHDAGVERHATLSADGTILVEGALDCPAGSAAQIHVSLSQPSTGATGQADWSGVCTGAGLSRAHRSQHWQLVVPPALGTSFEPGSGRAGLRFEGVLTVDGVSAPWEAAPVNLVFSG